MGSEGLSSPPCRATDPAEFAAAMRALRERSGLTCRELEARAAERGDVLPRGALADVLAGRTRPYPELLSAFVRACGDEERLPRWLESWDELARRHHRAGDAARYMADAPPVSAVREFRLPVALMTTGALVVISAVLWALTTSGGSPAAGDAPGPPPEGRGAGRRPAPPEGWVRLRPVSAPELCLTDGLVPDGRYDSPVAVQRPCDVVAPSATLLEPVGAGAYRIQWHHPDHGRGCLRVRVEGAGNGLLEPWDNCAWGSVFRVEPASGERHDGRYLLRVANGCVGIRDAAPTPGAEAVVTPCAPVDGQAFFIEPAPRPDGVASVGKLG